MKARLARVRAAIWALLGGASFGLAAADVQAATRDQRWYFGDWLVLCQGDQNKVCSANAVVRSERHPNLPSVFGLRISRAAWSGAWEITLLPTLEPLLPSASVAIKVDKRPARTFAPPFSLLTLGPKNEYVVADAQNASMLVDEMTRGRSAMVYLTGTGGQHMSWRMSLRGLRESISHIDEIFETAPPAMAAAEIPARLACRGEAPPWNMTISDERARLSETFETGVSKSRFVGGARRVELPGLTGWIWTGLDQGNRPALSASIIEGGCAQLSGPGGNPFPLRALLRMQDGRNLNGCCTPSGK